jgi:alpha-2-macroglobulin
VIEMTANRKLFQIIMLMAVLLFIGGPVSSGALTKKDLASQWKAIEELEKNQQYNAAIPLIEEIIVYARTTGDGALLTRGIIRRVRVERALHGYEQSIRLLLDIPWPGGVKEESLLHLFTATMFNRYYSDYRWEIDRREKIAGELPPDVKTWTSQDIFEAVNRHFALAWKNREVLGGEKIAAFSEYISQGDYPGTIRKTMRDFLVYQWVGFLEDTVTWRPEQLQEKYKLDLEKLIAVPAQVVLSVPELTNPDLHPLEKINYLLNDHYSWYQKTGDADSQLEALLTKLDVLIPNFTKAGDKKRIQAAFQELPGKYEPVSWWAHAQYKLALLIRAEGDLAAARRVALAGSEKYPGSVGGKECLRLVKEIEAPSFTIQVMANDRANQRSIQIEHANLGKLYFRAYRIDLAARFGNKEQFPLNQDWKEIQTRVLKRKADYSWETVLQNPGDFQKHTSFENPRIPGNETGLYTIAVSADRDFRSSRNQILTTMISISPFALILNSKPGEGSLEVLVRDGLTGMAVGDCRVHLYRYAYRQGTALAAKVTTDQSGLAVIPYQEPRTNGSYDQYFLVAEKEQQTACFWENLYFYRNSPPGEVDQVFIYTDRSIYRPLQKVYYKIVAYTGNSETNNYRVKPGAALTVTLVDPNGETIASSSLTTNDFGSASGEFAIPAGRLLGEYRIITDKGQTGFGVEEYKRPTFEAKLLTPDRPLRLNQPALLKGEAKYYFGMPVSAGEVKYRVTRAAIYPWWYSWRYFWIHSTPAQEVTAGKVKLGDDGKFELSFLPEGDESLPDKESVSYQYTVEATVTDSGGETKTANYTCRVGFVAVEATLTLDENFFESGEEVTVDIIRTNLNGGGEAGEGRYELLALPGPDQTLRAAEIPRETMLKQKIPGDLMRPRWEEPQDLTRTIHDWADGACLQSGPLTHDGEGRGRLVLRNLNPGVYRVRYQTKDDWGGIFNTQREFVVAGNGTGLKASHYLLARHNQAAVGEKLKVLVGTGFKAKQLVLETWMGDQLNHREWITLDQRSALLEIPVGEAMRGGFDLRMYLVEDYQVYQVEQHINVPFDNKELRVEFATFRDRLRPGGRENWMLNISGPEKERVSTEVLAYMYDRSLDYFRPHSYPSPGSLYGRRSSLSYLTFNTGSREGSSILNESWYTLPVCPSLSDSNFIEYDNYQVGGPGGRGKGLKMFAMSAPVPAAPQMDKAKDGKPEAVGDSYGGKDGGAKVPAPVVSQNADTTPVQADQPLRSDFAETAFFKPHLLPDADGNVKIEFEVPDSVTAWNFYVHALTRDLKFMTRQKEVVTRKELIVRPYLPRFFREGDRAALKVMINNAGTEPMTGEAVVEIVDPETNENLNEAFKVPSAAKKWEAKPEQSATLTWPLVAPAGVETYAFKVTAKTSRFSDGELRPVPVLPGRMHLIQSKFMTLRDDETRTMKLDDMERAKADASLENESLVVTLDGQLIYTVLRALPYLTNYPYECAEQTLNRFLSTTMVTSLYDHYPPIQKMARQFSERKTELEPWAKDDPNRRMELEETPWLAAAQGGKGEQADLINIFDANTARLNKESALAKLRKMQLPDGSFPWFEGGPPSDYMTLYLLCGFAKAREFGDTTVPKETVQRAWNFLKKRYQDEYSRKDKLADSGIYFLSFLNYVLSCFPEDYYQSTFSKQDRTAMLDRCYKDWRQLSPYLKAYLSLTLNRMGRGKDAKQVLESVMDSATTTRDEGTYWAREDRSWLWYNDQIESHAFILRALLEVAPQDERVDGLALWLLLNKKMNQWKSTRATAEVIYSLTHYMKARGALAVREEARVKLGNREQVFVFEPDVYNGAHNQVVVEGEKVNPEKMAAVQVAKQGKGMMFASMTWHYSTEKLPEEARGDLLAVQREYFVRRNVNKQMVLEPLKEGTTVGVGDEVEVHLSIRCKHPVEYVLLRDPRASGLEPEQPVSGHHWDLGICWYEEVRDSGANFFFEQLPQGEYTFKYRLRAAMAGSFRVGPATLQSLYAPEFAGYSTGVVMRVEEYGDGKSWGRP